MSGNASLTSAAFYDGLADIGAGVLFGCSALCAVELPATLAEIGDSAMEGAAAPRAIDAAGLSAVPATGTDVWFAFHCKVRMCRRHA